jgi:hypothetical protein
MTGFSTLPAGSTTGSDDSAPLSPVLLQELRKALGSIRYGSIELVIHDGRVVQLERRQKVRFESDPSKRNK